MPALAVIRSGCKGIEYLENRSTWQHIPHTDCLNGSDEEDDERLLNLAEEVWRSIGTNLGVSQNFGLLREICDVNSVHAFCCADCGNMVGDRDDIISKTFFGRFGRAFLMNTMYNVRMRPPRDRYLMTGMHSIADVLCGQCGYLLGWKYLRAMETSQRYKEGRFIMEHTAVDDESEKQVWDRV